MVLLRGAGSAARARAARSAAAPALPVHRAEPGPDESAGVRPASRALCRAPVTRQDTRHSPGHDPARRVGPWSEAACSAGEGPDSCRGPHPRRRPRGPPRTSTSGRPPSALTAGSPLGCRAVTACLRGKAPVEHPVAPEPRLPAAPGAVPADTGAVPTGTGAVPAGTGAVPAGTEPVCSGSRSLPAGAEPVPAPTGSLPAPCRRSAPQRRRDAGGLACGRRADGGLPGVRGGTRRAGDGARSPGHAGDDAVPPATGNILSDLRACHFP